MQDCFLEVIAMPCLHSKQHKADKLTVHLEPSMSVKTEYICDRKQQCVHPRLPKARPTSLLKPFHPHQGVAGQAHSLQKGEDITVKGSIVMETASTFLANLMADGGKYWKMVYASF